MNKILIKALFSVLAIGLISCNENDDNESGLVSQWHLVELLSDPGDGSGTFQAVSSEKTVSFFDDGTITSNGSLCTMGTDVSSASSGTYSISDSTITVDNCNFTPPFPVSYQSEGAFLIINYPCIEPCREKYEQIE
jgi:hypothetical protein